MGKSTFLQSAMLESVLGGSAYTKAATVYIALKDAGGTELSGSGYARVSVTNDSTSWNTSSAGSAKTNKIAFTFPIATGSWSAAHSVAIYDDPTAGNLLYSGTLTADVTVASGESCHFIIGALSITEA